MLRKFLCVIALVFFTAWPAFTQTSPPNSPPVRPQRQPPCWQVAGIEKSAMEQRWALERETHAQVEAVCSNSSLTPQQKRQQVREIREQAHQKMEGILTADQEKALTSCQQARGMNHPAPHPGTGGGCGEMPPNAPPPTAPNGAAGSAGSNSPPPSNPQN